MESRECGQCKSLLKYCKDFKQGHSVRTHRAGSQVIWSCDNCRTVMDFEPVEGLDEKTLTGLRIMKGNWD